MCILVKVSELSDILVLLVVDRAQQSFVMKHGVLAVQTLVGLAEGNQCV